MAYGVNSNYIDEAKIQQGQEVLVMLSDLENNTYGAYLVKIAKSKSEIPDGDDLWVKNDHGELMNKSGAWGIKILEEYDLDSEEGQKAMALSEKWTL
jgi:hypothetical protein